MKRATKTEASRAKILDAAGKAFRRHGLGGIGVDGLAKNAQLTSGAFYVHFKSKMEAFLAAIGDGLQDLSTSLAKIQSEAGSDWASKFASLYLGAKRTCSLEQGCTVPLLSSEVERAGPEVRCEYEKRMEEIFKTLAKGLPSDSETTSEDRAYAYMALLAGGALISRTVLDQKLSQRIAAAVQQEAIRLSMSPDMCH